MLLLLLLLLLLILLLLLLLLLLSLLSPKLCLVRINSDIPPPYSRRRFSMVDVQNATLSGGVAVGAVADLRMQPFGAMAAGSAAAAVATFGFR